MARPTDWVDTAVNLTVAAAGQTVISLITGLSPADMRGTTLIRTLVRLFFSSTTVAGAWGFQVAHIGIGITSQEAFAAGVVPDPSVSGDRPARGWVYRSALGVSQNGVAHPITFDLAADIRGARKIENGELFLAVDQIGLQGTSFATNVQGLVRVLMKLA